MRKQIALIALSMFLGHLSFAGNGDVGSAGHPSAAAAHVVCQSVKNAAMTTIELLPTSIAGKFQIKTSQVQQEGSGIVSKNQASEQVSQAMNCQVTSSNETLTGASCNLAILNIKFERNSDGQFTISQAMSIPGQPNFKDPSAINYGSNFECQIEK